MFTIAVSVFMYGKYPNNPTYIACGFISVGAIVAGLDSFDLNYVGYALTFLYNITAAIYSVMAKHFNEKYSLTTFEVNTYIAILWTPMTFIMCGMVGQLDPLWNFDLTNYGLIYWLILQSLMGTLLTVGIAACSILCSPVTMNVSSTIKDAGFTWVGFTFFDDAIPEIKLLLGIGISFIGSMIYTTSKVMDIQKKSK